MRINMNGIYPQNNEYSVTKTSYNKYLLIIMVESFWGYTPKKTEG